MRQHVQHHGEAGLQPERTDLAWGRTALALVVAAAAFLRWMPHHGSFAGTLVAASVTAAATINFNRKRRFLRAVTGIRREYLPPDLVSPAAVAASVVLLAILGIYTTLFLPLT